MSHYHINRLKKHTSASLLTFLFIAVVILTGSASASDAGVTAAAGIKSIMYHDDTGTRSYYKPFATGGFTSSMIDLAAEYYRWQGYTATDNLMNENIININQPGIATTVYLTDTFSISGDYYYLFGDDSYKAKRYSAEISADTGLNTFYLEYFGKRTSYFVITKIRNIENGITAGMNLGIDEKSSLDISYEWLLTDYSTYGSSTHKHSVRIGGFSKPNDSLLCLGGITASHTSDGTKTCAIDAGITLKLFDMIKLNFSYMLTGYFLPDSISSGTSPLYANANGKSSADSGFESINAELSHTLSLGISLYH